ncbi:hypothetical protein T06_3448 [Trichinella sp. T6]|nr:hypothetical protein T06_3448 [Trichinella sp. T6]
MRSLLRAMMLQNVLLNGSIGFDVCSNASYVMGVFDYFDILLLRNYYTTVMKIGHLLCVQCSVIFFYYYSSAEKQIYLNSGKAAFKKKQ